MKKIDRDNENVQIATWTALAVIYAVAVYFKLRKRLSEVAK